MSSLHAATADDQPTPDPCSAVVESGGDGFVGDALATAMEQARRLYGSETGDAWFAALADGTHPLCHVATPGRADTRRGRLTEADLVTDPAMLAAAAQYAGDLTPAREIADAKAGRHPLQRRPPLAP